MKKILSLALVLILVAACLAACGKSGGVAGKYNLVSMTMDGETINVSDLEAIAGRKMEAYIELKADGTGIMVMEGERTEMAWADGKIWPVSDPDEKADFTVSGKTLTINESGVVMKFEK